MKVYGYYAENRKCLINLGVLRRCQCMPNRQHWRNCWVGMRRQKRGSREEEKLVIKLFGFGCEFRKLLCDNLSSKRTLLSPLRKVLSNKYSRCLVRGRTEAKKTFYRFKQWKISVIYYQSVPLYLYARQVPCRSPENVRGCRLSPWLFG